MKPLSCLPSTSELSSLQKNSQIELLSTNLFATVERLLTQSQQLERNYNHLEAELFQANKLLREKVVELEVISCYLNALLDNMDQGLLQIRTDGIVTSYNSIGEKLLEIPRSKLLSRPYSESIRDDLFGFSISDALGGKTFSPTKISIHGRTLEIQMQLIEVAAISHKGVMLLLRDITEEIHWQRLALRNERLHELGEMAAALAHEIRNPLGGIEGFASLLARDLEGSPLQPFATYITQGTQTLNRLVNDALDYVHPLKLQLQPCNLHQIYSDLVSHLKADAATPDSISFVIQPLCHETWIKGDLTLLRSALMNLMINGIQAIALNLKEVKGTLTATFTRTDKNEVALCISDNGCGIPPELVEKVFSPFFTTKNSGTGLGLPQAYKIIQSHGGSITLRANPSSGTDALLLFPLHAINAKI